MLKNKILVGLIAVAVIVLSLVVLRLIGVFTTSTITLGVDEKINNTPVSVERMRQIGEWEFLSISDEEMVDTVRRRLFAKDELVRIYYGELRLGIDMREMSDNAIKQKGDSVIVTLPKIKLLDDNFIDEARTKSFYESGTWDNKAREVLYQKAKRQMKQNCLTQENLNIARKNAVNQMEKMLSSMGVSNVRVE